MTSTQRDALVEQFDKASRITAAEPVAVVGIGCRFPGGVSGPEAYWNFLAGGGDAIVEVPPDRWDAEAYYDADPLVPGRMPSKWGGFLSDVKGFDAEFFGITPREADAMDPQQRVLLEVAWEALEHAGMAPDELSGTRAGVMMGVYYNEYQSASAGNPDTIDAYSATGNAHSVTVGRIAYLLGLRGPAVAVDTACSSSLVSIHLACQSLRMRESDLGLAGGVNLILRPETQLALGKWGMLSPRGRCSSFDASADGFVRGEGAGVVVLKRLTDAVRDGDRVLAVIRGSAVNQDGRSNGLTAPNAPAQRDVITRALRSSDVQAASVNFVETHGTGTALGDPIEFDALSAVYGQGDAPCALGAVKTNMGHLEAAAGIAGFIKSVLAVQRGKIPPNLHFSQWNPAIEARSTRLFVPTETAPWPQADGPRRAGVSSFGLGGTNAHIVIEQGPDAQPSAVGGTSITVLTVSGRSAERVALRAAALADWLDGAGADAALADVAYTLERQRGRSSKFAQIFARDRAQAVVALRSLAAGQPSPGVAASPEGPPRGPGVVFVYSGQGAQWAGMGKQLLVDEPAFAAAVAELEPVFVAQVGFSLSQVLEAGEPVVGIDRIQPVLVGMQLALTALWRSYGVEPDAVIGHSMGEVAAAVVAGALSPADGLKVIGTRSRLMARLSGTGAMALLELNADETKALIGGHPDVTLAVHASPTQTVVAGPPDQIDALIAQLQERNRLARRVEVDVASHHPTVDPILAELRTELSGLTPATPRIRLISTADAAAAPVMDADYWVNNLRNPVRFSQAVTAAAESYATFIEISPHPLLTHGVAETLEAVRPKGDTAVLATLTRDADDTVAFHTQLATLRAALGQATPDGGGSLTDLPPQPWRHSSYWMASTPVRNGSATDHPLLGTHIEMPSGTDHVWQGEVGTELIGWLIDHKVHGQPIMPAAGFAEMALAAGGIALGGTVGVHRLEVEQMLPLSDQTTLTTQLTIADGGARVEIHSRPAGGTWLRHAVARVEPARAHSAAPRKASQATDGSPVSPADFYTAMRRTGAHHGPAFAALTRIVRTPGGVSDSEIVLPDEATAHRGYRLHPVMLDAALQGLAAAMPAESLAESAEATYLPVSIESLRVFADVGRRARCHAELVALDDGSGDKLGSFTLTDDAGTVLAEASGIYLRRVQRRTVPLPLSQKVFDTEWIEAPSAGGSGDDAPRGSWLVLSHDPDTKAIAEDFTARFASPTRRIVGAELTDESAVLRAFAEAAADPELPPAGVVLLVERRAFDGTDADGAMARAKQLIWSVSGAAKAVVGGWHGKAPRLWVVSRNGLAVSADEPGDPAVGALRGLVRVLAYEHPDLRATLVDIEDTADVVAALTTELNSPGNDDVIGWRGGTRFVERLSRATLVERQPESVVRTDGAYIVTGGLGGLGLVVAGWLVDRGAGRVVLNGRSEPAVTPAAMMELQRRAEIVYVAGDIATPGVADRLVSAAERDGLRLRGLVHSAAVIDDGLVTSLSSASLDRVWAPKATGALRLHEATASRELDWWVGFSSVASLLGSPGQGAYASANAWMDALVTWRRAAGLPATSINWGQWSDVGVARALTIDVLDPISPAEGIEAMESLVGQNLGQAGVARLRLDRAAAAFPEISQIGYFAHLVAELDTVADSDWPGADGLRELEPKDAHDMVLARLRARVAAIMGYADDTAVDPDQPLTELGMDSLMAVRIRNTVRGDFGVEPPVALLLQGATPKELAADLIRQLGLGGTEPEEQSGGLRDRAQQRAAARQKAASRRKTGQRA